MKKLISVMMAVLLIVSCIAPVAFASGTVTAIVEIADSRAGTISISDSFAPAMAGKKINVLVTNPGFTYADAASNSSAIQYQDVIVVGSDGKANTTFTLNLPGGFTDGTFIVRLSGSAYQGGVKEYPVYFLPFAAQVGLATDLYNKVMAYDVTNETSVTDALTVLEANKDGLAYGTNAFNAVTNKKAIVEALKAYWTLNPVNFGLTPDTEEIAVKSIQERIKVRAVISAYNEGKSSVLFNSQKDVIDSALLGLETRLSSTTVATIATSVDMTGKGNIASGMINKNIADEDAFAKLYAKNVLVNAIKHNIVQGTAVITDVLTSANVTYAGYAIPNYLALGDKTSANTIIMQRKDEIDVNTLATIVEECVASASVPAPAPTPGIGGTGPSFSFGATPSGGGGGGAVTPVLPPVKVIDFKDIKNHKWAETAINYLAAEGIINGTGDNNFEPEANLTREQAVKIICLAFNLDVVKASSKFDDEAENAWYSDYIATARKAGFVNGKTDTVFGVGESITRQDFAVMLYRAMSNPELNGQADFVDNGDIADYAMNAVSYFKLNKIINGYEDNTFKPGKTITRAEAAQLTYSIITR